MINQPGHKGRNFGHDISPELTNKEKTLILSDSMDLLSIREDCGPVRLFSDDDILRIFIPGSKDSEQIGTENIIAPRDLFRSKKVLVVPGYGNLPFLLKTLGAKSVVGIDKDPVVIALQKARVLYGKHSLIKRFFTDTFDDSATYIQEQNALIKGLKDLVEKNTDTSTYRLNDIYFLQGDLIKALPIKDGEFDFIIVPYLFNMPQGINFVNNCEPALKQLLRVAKLDGTILIMPAKITSWKGNRTTLSYLLAPPTLNAFCNWLTGQEDIEYKLSNSFKLTNFIVDDDVDIEGTYILIRHKLNIGQSVRSSLSRIANRFL